MDGYKSRTGYNFGIDWVYGDGGQRVKPTNIPTTTTAPRKSEGELATLAKELDEQEKTHKPIEWIRVVRDGQRITPNPKTTG